MQGGPIEIVPVSDHVAGGAINATFRRPSADVCVIEWDPARMIWRIRGDWTIGKIESEDDYQVNLRTNLTSLCYTLLSDALKRYPKVQTFEIQAVIQGKIPPEIAAKPGRKLIRMGISRNTVERLGWKGMSDLFPPRELVEVLAYHEYLRLSQD